MNLLKSATIAVLILSALLLSQCKKDHDVLGIEAQPESDILKSESRQNLAVSYHTIPYDSVISLNTDLKFIGYNDDGQIGVTDIGLYTNVNLNATNVDFGDDAILINSELILAVNPLYINGKKDAVLSYSVFTVDSLLDPERAYYTNNKALHNKNNIVGTAVTTFTTFGSVFCIRIPIDPAYATEILTNKNNLVNNATFQAAHKGFYIQASANGGEGVITQCNLALNESGFYLNYKRPSSPTDTLISYKFEFAGADAARFNTVTFNPSPGMKAQLDGDTSLGKQKVYLKGMGVNKIKVQIPFLKNYGDTFRVAVSRAELIIKIDPSYLAAISGTSSTYAEPPKLALLAMDSTGRELLTTDQRNPTYISRYSGDYDETEHQYVFNFPLHAEDLLKGKRKNCGFYLVVTDPTPPYVAFRDTYMEGCILAGYEAYFKPVFNLSYVRLKQ